jgi:hypothetical protein
MTLLAAVVVVGVFVAIGLIASARLGEWIDDRRVAKEARRADFTTTRARVSWKTSAADGIRPPRPSVQTLSTPRSRRRRILRIADQPSPTRRGA